MSKILNYFSKNLLTRFYLYKYVNFFFNDVSFIDKIKINYFFKNSNISYLTSSILVFKLIFSKIFFNNFKNNFFKVTINLKKGFPFTFYFQSNKYQIPWHQLTIHRPQRWHPLKSALRQYLKVV